MSRTVCPCTDCNRALSIGTLMCLAHWRMLSKSLQYAVNKAWRRLRAARSGRDVQELLDAIQAHTDAANTAIEYVNAEIQKLAPIAGDGAAA